MRNNRWDSEVIYELVNSVSYIFAIKITYEIIFQAHSILWEFCTRLKIFFQGFLQLLWILWWCPDFDLIFPLWGWHPGLARSFPEVSRLELDSIWRGTKDFYQFSRRDSKRSGNVQYGCGWGAQPVAWHLVKLRDHDNYCHYEYYFCYASCFQGVR